jgi:hypothetical protein
MGQRARARGSGDAIESMAFSLNGSEQQPLSFREDQHRIAQTGNFNVEIPRSELREGANELTIIVKSTDGRTQRHRVTINYVRWTNAGRYHTRLNGPKRKQSRTWPKSSTANGSWDHTGCVVSNDTTTELLLLVTLRGVITKLARRLWSTR